MAKRSTGTWFVYILRCADGMLYTGITKDRQCRFEHVAAVQAACKEAGVENVRVQALTTSSD